VLKDLVHQIERDVPVGFHHREKPVEISEMPDIKKTLSASEFLGELIPDARCQLGTMGGNNHFLELQINELGELCVMVHSGSRNLGKKVCDHYNEIAEEIHKQWHIPHPDKLAWLPADSEEGEAYINDMNYCIDFACRNRKKMLDIIKADIGKVLDIEWIEELDIHHNYASLEHHFGRDVWVHRKGATSARLGQRGIIPGSMGTKSYIVEGLGNPLSLTSCSHGAGRNTSRTEYNKTHTIEQANREMAGIVHSEWGLNRRGEVDLSEAPSAYKDIDEVMNNQKDLVRIVHTLKPIACVKG
jgi:tRNA-splicing ligase RtcB